MFDSSFRTVLSFTAVCGAICAFLLASSASVPGADYDTYDQVVLALN